MIALRGTIKRVVQPPGNEAKTPPSKNINGPGSGEWIWTGYWAFDSLPAPEVLENRKSKRPPHGVRPFVYKFHHIEDAKDVIVPSTTLGDDQDIEEGNRDKEKEEDMNIDTEKIHRNDEVNDQKVNDVMKKEEKSVEQSSEVLEQDSTNVDTEMKNDDSDKTSDNVGSDEKKEHDNSLKEDVLQKSVQLNDDTKFKNDNVEEATIEKRVSKESQEDKNEENENDERTNRSHVGSSFADIDGGVYTDGGMVHPEKCPKGGVWKGYFENVSKRKDRMTSRVQETFHLFFNATPPQDASIAFYDAIEDDNTDKNDDESKEGSIGAPQDASKEVDKPIVDDHKSELPDGYLHVRGAGTNIFGTFEILGGFNVETSVLEIQRIYVITNDMIEEETKQPRVRSKSKPKVPSPASERKSYFTRKRPTVLFRYGDSPEPERSSSAKKRQRGSSEHGPLSPLEGIDNEKMKRISVTIPGKEESQDLSISAVDNVSTKMSGTRRPSPDKITPKSSAKSKGTSTQAEKMSGVSPVLMTQSSFAAIPKAGKPEDARWRSAHYLYYHRHTDDPETSNNPSHTPSTSYVIYEGDMNEGGCIRNGKGVCLYNNDYIYEGDWRNNKEHGKGTLFSGDRKRKIYEGEWERGKMVSFFYFVLFSTIYF